MRHLRRVVLADDEEQLRLRMARLHLAHRVDGVRFAAALQFEVPRLQNGMRSAGILHKRPAERIEAAAPPRLERIMRRRHHQHLVESLLGGGLQRHTDMTGVDGVEGAAKDSDPFHVTRPRCGECGGLRGGHSRACPVPCPRPEPGRRAAACRACGTPPRAQCPWA